MVRIVNPNTIRPTDLKPGDVMIRTVTLHFQQRPDDKLRYRVYVCPYVDPETEDPDDLWSISDGVPQGSRVFDGAEEVARQIFPIIGWAETRPDLY